jgi:hypothetical protein
LAGGFFASSFALSACATMMGRSGNAADCANASVGMKAIEAISNVRFIEIFPCQKRTNGKIASVRDTRQRATRQ